MSTSMIGLIGKKCGMSRVFLENGASCGVTLIEVTPNIVSQIKTQETGGYYSLQLNSADKRLTHLNKPLLGHLKKTNAEKAGKLVEFRVSAEILAEKNINPGDIFRVDLFKEGQHVDIVGITKGKGFAGTVKRHNFRTQDATHGNSRSHRVPGSIGQNQTPGRVFKGKRMAGHLGNERCTTVNQAIIKIDLERNLIAVKGSVPGAPGSYVIIKPSVKAALEE